MNPRGAEGASNQAPDFRALHDDHVDFVWRSLRLLGVARELLDDAAQDVFRIAFGKIEDFMDGCSLRTWLFAIAQKTAANYRRMHKRKLAPLVPLGEHADEAPADLPLPDAELMARQAARHIQQFCEQLDDERKALFALSLIEGVPAGELSSHFGVPVATIYTRIHSLRRDLKCFMEKNGAWETQVQHG